MSAGIAAYKTPDLVRKLGELGAEVQVILSKNADQFVSPLSLQAVSGQAVHSHAMTAESESGMGHIDLARWADIVLIAPATANLMARLCQGNADELLTTVCVATEAPIAIAPAMNQQMWQNPASVANLATLASRGMHILGPDTGQQACGEVGPGRMLQPEDIAERVGALFQNTELTGKRVMITAGPTWEALDPVRGITNHSSGLMGYALAQAAIEAGAEVTLVSGPTHIEQPARATIIDVVSALDMHAAVISTIDDQDIFIGVAAVADYRPIDAAGQKIKKNADQITITMVRNPDILADVASRKNPPFCVGFAAETNDVVDYARGKLQRKKLDLIAANHVGGSETGFGTPDNAITLISENSLIELPKQNKSALARTLMAEIAKAYTNK
ncbi:MAG: phosphopantothenoylcysteine decarboxylase/phosphopantothenate--cysteine ligase [Arenicella sp.]